MDKPAVTSHEIYMRLAVNEAVKGLGRTAPNPAVGAVIVNQGKVVGRGYHHKAGTPHAEVHAIADAGEAARGGTIYVTLEPCNHTGRTPPCTQAILRAGLARVVIGAMDPNPKVVGGGAAFLRSQRIEVLQDVLGEPCRDLIRPFVKHSRTGLPWVIMKAGLSLDGRISRRRGEGGAITGVETHEAVHLLRDQVDTILIGIGTVLVDDPSLTTRLPGKTDTRDPVRVVLDTQLRMPPQARMLNQQSNAPTWIVCGPDAPREREDALLQSGAVIHRVDLDVTGKPDLGQVLALIGQSQMLSVLVEGGSAVHGAFWRQQLVDELRLYFAPLFIGDQGVPLISGFALVQDTSLTNVALHQLGCDFLFRALVEQKMFV